MRIATPGQLSMRLDRAMSWRKKELTQQKLLADSASAGNASVLRRSGITLMYAHWEGFIKDASVYYLRFLSVTPLELTSLRSCFVAVAIRNEIRSISQARRTSVHSRLVDLFRSMEPPHLIKRRLPVDGVISTRANLKSTALREITATLGLDYAPFELKEKAVIDRLVAFRNNIAHGKGLAVSQSDYSDLHTEIIALLETYKGLIENAATNSSHIR